MKIIAFNGSPRGQLGNTDRILQPFLEGAREAGAETEIIYLKDKKINPCLGCSAMTCWVETPGVCCQQDDMTELLEKYLQADIVVSATPLYYFTVTGLMKNFIDRQLPLIEPYSVKRGNMYFHGPRHKEAWPKKGVLISNCGFPERVHFDGLVETFRRMSAVFPDFELTAIILCAAGVLFGMPVEPAMEQRLRTYINAARCAGRELVERGRIMPATQEVLDSLLADPVLCSQGGHDFFSSITGRRVTIEGASVNSTVSADTLSPALPLPPDGRSPENFHDAITVQAAAFNPKAANDLRADLQFCVTGQESGDYVLRIADGSCTVHTGKVVCPALVVHTPSEVWLQIARGELNGQTAFTQGLYRTEGDIRLLMRMSELFSGKVK